MQAIVALLCLGALLWAGPAAAQKTYSLTVSRHESVRLTDSQARAILRGMTKLLRNAPNRCNVTFKLAGPVKTFASRRTPGVIQNSRHLDAVAREAGDVKVVKDIQFCRRNQEPKDGCTWPPRARTSMLVTQNPGVAPRVRHILWAHEFGHRAGLEHVKESDRLMTSCSLQTTAGLITEQECKCFLKGPRPNSCRAPRAQRCSIEP
jgi:hypothetical protein